MNRRNSPVRSELEREPRWNARARKGLYRTALFAIAIASVMFVATTASGDGVMIDPAATNARAKLKARIFAQEEGLKRRARVAGYRLLIEDLRSKPRLTAGEREELAALNRLLATEEAERSKR